MKKNWICILTICGLLTACNAKKAADNPEPQNTEIAAKSEGIDGLTDEQVAEGRDCENATTMTRFVACANEALRRTVSASEQMNWAYMTNINAETEAAVTKSETELMAERSKLMEAANKFKASDAQNDDELRQWNKIRTDTTQPPPKDPAKRERLAEISAKLMGYYGSAKSCDGAVCRDLGALSKVLETSRNPEEMKAAWLGWHNAFDSQKPLYQEFVSLANEGSRDIGFKDLSEVWLAGYDASSEEIRAQVNELWEELKPLYEQLHCYVRAKLAQTYGEDVVPLNKPIPAHLLGNMWAQEWNNIYSIVIPHPNAPNIDATPKIKETMQPIDIVHNVENFYTSIGFKPLPESFYTHSMFVKPADREVVCHASAWDLDTKGDVRIKMCIEPNLENLTTIQHEMGHIYYYLYYNDLPFVYQNGANDGFHEGIGDTVTLSMTPKYLKEIGLIESLPSDESCKTKKCAAAMVDTMTKMTINQQMQSALEKIAFLPFGLLIDEWRWRVFDGSIPPEKYNEAWWQLREELQGVSAPEPRDENHFDAGAKYHVPGNTPYLRYFLARVLQFQFHKALCDAAGHVGPLHECSIYQSKKAGEKLIAMLSKGSSQPWQKTLEEMTGSPKMSAAAMIEYYQPLIQYLKEQNQGRTCEFSFEKPIENKKAEKKVSQNAKVASDLKPPIPMKPMLSCYNRCTKEYYQVPSGSGCVNIVLCENDF